MFMSSAFQETRTDRSPIPLKGGTLGMDRNVCVLLSATLEQCFSLSQAIIVVSQILKKYFTSCFHWLGKVWYSSPENAGIYRNIRKEGRIW